MLLHFSFLSYFLSLYSTPIFYFFSLNHTFIAVPSVSSSVLFSHSFSYPCLLLRFLCSPHSLPSPPLPNRSLLPLLLPAPSPHPSAPLTLTLILLLPSSPFSYLLPFPTPTSSPSSPLPSPFPFPSPFYPFPVPYPSPSPFYPFPAPSPSPSPHQPQRLPIHLLPYPIPSPPSAVYGRARAASRVISPPGLLSIFVET